MNKLNQRMDELEEAQKKLREFQPKKTVRDSADDYIEYATVD